MGEEVEEPQNLLEAEPQTGVCANGKSQTGGGVRLVKVKECVRAHWSPGQTLESERARSALRQAGRATGPGKGSHQVDFLRLHLARKYKQVIAVHHSTQMFSCV